MVRDSQATPRAAPTAAKHWKKSISRNYSGGENREPGPLSPATSTTAEALLSLGRAPGPAPRLLPVQPAPARPTQPRIVQPWTSEPRKGPTDISNVSSSPLFPSHPLPPVHFQPLAAPPLQPGQLALPQQPAPLKEVQSNLQLSVKPPFSLSSLSKPVQLGGSGTWHQPVQEPPLSPTNPLFRHSIFTCENTEDGSTGGDKPVSFQCHECKKSFSTQSGFAKHKQLHCSNQIQRDITCSHCNKAYNSQSALKMHIRTHTLPCKCPQCGKSFSRPWLLQGHMRTHTGEKPFGCTECARTFADKSNLRAHLQTHLQNKKYSCPGCQKTFSRMSLLNKHTDSGCIGLQSQNPGDQDLRQDCAEALISLNPIHQSSAMMRS